jgi:uncharacterized protein YneF (UPF0154 family)
MRVVDVAFVATASLIIGYFIARRVFRTDLGYALIKKLFLSWLESRRKERQADVE